MIPSLTSPPPPPTPSKGRKKPTPKPRTPRVISPEVEALRKEYHEKVKALRGSKVSERILGVIINKRLPQLTKAHREFLFNELAKEFTPLLLPANRICSTNSSGETA